MSGILDISIGGLNAATTRIANAASSIVNALSTTSSVKNNASNNTAPRDSISISGSDGLDGAIVDSITARADYGANAAAIKIENKIEKSLLDIKT